MTICTICIPNRDRDLAVVRNTLSSITAQIREGVEVVIVDYGSERSYQVNLQSLVAEYSNISVLCCPTQYQLWHKSRAINIVLKNCETEYFIVLDMDCMVHPHFLDQAMRLMKDRVCINFPYGFLTKEESKKEMPYEQYTIDFIGKLTGTIIVKTKELQAINGYDEFYHNWGAEDADVLMRLENNGVANHLYEDEVLLLHQWHTKEYRSEMSTKPYHSQLEKINHSYYHHQKAIGATSVNKTLQWGVSIHIKDYQELRTPHRTLNLKNNEADVKGLLLLLSQKTIEGVSEIYIKAQTNAEIAKATIKRALGKKTNPIMPMFQVNNQIIELIISTLRNCPYQYQYDRTKEVIILKIKI